MLTISITFVTLFGVIRKIVFCVMLKCLTNFRYTGGGRSGSCVCVSLVVDPDDGVADTGACKPWCGHFIRDGIVVICLPPIAFAIRLVLPVFSRSRA